MNIMRLRRLALVGMALAGASCAGPKDSHRYDAEFSAWAMELTWKHEWEAPPAPGSSAGPYRFESLKLVLKPSRLGEDQDIDGSLVVGTYLHGGTDWCTKPHRVAGKVRLLEIGPAEVRARVDAVMNCSDSEPVALRGECTFETKTPP